MTSIHRQLRVLVGALFISTLLTAGSVRGAPSGNTIYVKHDAVGNNDGSSWTDAYTDLQDALVIAQPGHEIWVAQGVYYPAPNALDRTATFELQDGVPLYGGFTGMETEREQRDWEANVTVLSGDLDRNDITTNGVVTDTANIAGDNAYHVVTGGGVTETAVLAGFTITAGKADGGTGQTGGGGMYNTSSSPTLTNVTFTGNYARAGGGMYNSNSSPTLTNVTFSGNYANYGGGMNNAGSSPTLTNVTFSGNSAYYDAGGMKNWESSPTLTNVTFIGNYTRHCCVFVTRGGAMLNSRNSSPTLTNVTFSGNSAGSLGGGMHNDESSPTLTNVVFSGNDANLGGGMNNYYKSNPTLTNVTFSGNSAEEDGGGMRNDGSSPMLTNVVFSGNYANDDGGGMRNRRNSSPTLTNVTFSGNYARAGGGMYNSYSSPTLTNCIVWGNEALQGLEIFNFDDDSQPTVSYSSIRGNYPGEGNIDADPLFVEPVSANKAPTTDGDYRLTEGSPAIDAGTKDVITADTDLDGNPRIVDGTGDGNAIVDMGAYEYLEVLLTIVKEGQGLVAGASGLVDCGSLCTAGFLADTELTLTATADPSWSFVGWSGDVESIENSLELTIQDDTELIATFEPREMKVYLPLILADR